MIISRIGGGLGNQLFQYACGRALAVRHNVPLYLDVSGFNNNGSNRSFQLNHFRIRADIATTDMIYKGIYWRRDSLGKMCRFINRMLPYHNQRNIQEKSLLFDKNFVHFGKNVYLMGYWASEKYFKPIEDKIREEIQLRKEPFGINGELMRQINSVNSVSLHVRRGDYLLGKGAEFFGVLTLEYYLKAMEYLSKNISNLHYFVFSDDPLWAQEHFKNVGKCTIVSNNSQDVAYFDLALMKCCKYHVVANSSFSWWGAWLCTFKDKIVIAPKMWHKSLVDTRDLIPKEWMQI